MNSKGKDLRSVWLLADTNFRFIHPLKDTIILI